MNLRRSMAGSYAGLCLMACPVPVRAAPPYASLQSDPIYGCSLIASQIGGVDRGNCRQRAYATKIVEWCRQRDCLKMGSAPTPGSGLLTGLVDAVYGLGGAISLGAASASRTVGQLGSGLIESLGGQAVESQQARKAPNLSVNPQRDVRCYNRARADAASPDILERFSQPPPPCGK